jgi:molybdate transport system regulatory protein
MKPVMRLFLYDDDGERFFGEGPCILLHGIEKTGSLRSAAMEMDMAYTKALNMIKRAEKALGFPLTERSIGGKGGGGSRLTPKAKEFLERYECYRDKCYEAGRQLYLEVFSDQQ